MDSNPPALPSPIGRRTHGVYRTADDALTDGYNLVALMNGIPFGFKMSVVERLGAFALISYPSDGHALSQGRLPT